MSDRVAVINGGRIVQLDTPRALYERPANRFVAEFIGESSFVPVAVREGRVMLNGAALTVASHPGGDGPRLLMLRPERLKILAGGTGAGMNILNARVQATVYQGDSSLVQAALADGSVVSVRGASGSNAGHACPGAGDMIALGLAVDDTVLLPREGTA